VADVLKDLIDGGVEGEQTGDMKSLRLSQCEKEIEESDMATLDRCVK